MDEDTKTKLITTIESMEIEDLQLLKPVFEERLGKVDVNYGAWLTAQRHAAGFRELYYASLGILHGDMTIYDQSQYIDLGTLLFAMLKMEKDVRDNEAADEEQDPSEIK